MNLFPLLHQVIVAGGLDPMLLHSRKDLLDTEKGSRGTTMPTVRGRTEIWDGNVVLYKKICTISWPHILLS